MGIPLRQQIKVGAYVLRQHLRGRKRYPLVLMLEPLFRCNLACSGCGKIDYPDPILNQRLSFDQCMAAIEECGAPAVSIAGGEPLLHREMPKIVEGYIARKKFVILCTNALLLDEKVFGIIPPHKRLTVNVHLDGLEETHDYVCAKEGVYEKALAMIRESGARNAPSSLAANAPSSGRSPAGTSGSRTAPPLKPPNRPAPLISGTARRR